MDHGNPLDRRERRRAGSAATSTSRSCPTRRRLAVGDRVRVVPAHIDPTMAMHECAWLVRGDEVLDRWPIDLRGWHERAKRLQRRTVVRPTASATVVPSRPTEPVARRSGAPVDRLSRSIRAWVVIGALGADHGQSVADLGPHSVGDGRPFADAVGVVAGATDRSLSAAHRHPARSGRRSGRRRRRGVLRAARSRRPVRHVDRRRRSPTPTCCYVNERIDEIPAGELAARTSM